MQNDYIQINKQAYDDTADEFDKKVAIRQESDEKMVADMLKYFPVTSHPALLELGTGSGYIANLFSNYGYEVSAVEISPKMAEVAKKHAPKVNIIVDDFLAHDFAGKTFDVIVGIAFVHLFTEQDAKRVIDKIHGLLNKNGVCVLSTTLHEQDAEGFIEKSNFTTKVKRFRRQYTTDSFCNLIFTKLEKVDVFENDDSEKNAGKRWLNVVSQKL